VKPTIDASITCASVISTTKLVHRVLERVDPDDSRELARRNAEALKHPDRRVGAALMPKKRGGGESPWQVGQRAERNNVYRDLAMAQYGTTSLTPKQAKAISRKVRNALDDARLMEGGGSLQADAIRRIRASDLKPIGERQLLRIFDAKK
jgi:hypothetical protein